MIEPPYARAYADWLERGLTASEALERIKHDYPERFGSEVYERLWKHNSDASVSRPRYNPLKRKDKRTP